MCRCSGQQCRGEAETEIRSESGTYPAAPAARSASSGRLCPAGVCDFFVSCTGCTLWLCLGFELETPVWQTAVSDTCRNYSNDASPQGFKVTFLKKNKTATTKTKTHKTRAISASDTQTTALIQLVCNTSLARQQSRMTSGQIEHTCCKLLNQQQTAGII